MTLKAVSKGAQIWNENRIHQHYDRTLSSAAESTKFQRLQLRLRLRFGKSDSDTNSDNYSDSDPHQSLFPNVEGQCLKQIPPLQ